ncbi:hypothetical protein KUV50_16220 [Membranicola marinus]|uniref:Uncharacterized protein n=1 Tax=Membranihabitans marinus TaxID=1227546 RepID=A0A953HZQ9_9BACT|nr:hypothetical protein [Membranihabitans marinus]MBY5959701.1 hypothetical protein [Membranihabitans marinus]
MKSSIQNQPTMNIRACLYTFSGLPMILITLLILLSPSGVTVAQTNSGISYQAVVRNSKGDMIENDQVGIRFSILHGTPNGNVLYQERQEVKTNEDGLISLIIGAGSNIQGDFDKIDWSAGPRFLQTEVDPDGGSQYTISGVTEMTAVPYAYYAEHVKNTDDADADPANEIQNLNLSGTTLSISQGNDVDLSPLTGTDAQTLTYDNNTGQLNISGGNAVTLPLSSGGDNWGSQHIVSDSTLTGNGTSADPLSVVQSSGPSLWKKESGKDDIYYDEGTVQVKDNFYFSEMNAQHFTNMDYDSIQASRLDNFSLDFNAKNGSYSSGYGALGAYVTIDSQNLEMNSYRVMFSDEENIPSAVFTPDSLTMHSQVGLLYPEVATLKAGELRMEWLYTGLKSRYGAGSTTHENGEHQSILNPYQLDIWETTQSTPFHRLHLSGDSLQMFNSAKWKTVDIKGDNSIGGQINLYNLSGSKLSFLGGTDLPGVGGKLCLFTPGQDIEKFCALATEDFGGELTLFGKEFANFYAGGEDNKGHAYVADTTGLSRAGMSVNDEQKGVLYTRGGYVTIQDKFGTDLNGIDQDILWMGTGIGTPSLVIGKSLDIPEAGYQLIFGKNHTPNVYLGYDETISPGNVGIINLFDGNGDRGASINGMGDIKGRTFELKNGNGDVTHSQGIFLGGNPYSNLYAPSGNIAISMSTDPQQNGGELRVYDKSGNDKASIYVDNAGVSHIVANVKNFRIDHPTDSSKEIWYASVEGPEAAIYQRGTAQVVDGECFVPFADHFRVILNTSSATVQLTPRHWDTFGLAVTSITDTGFYVKELKGGTGQFEFDWEVKAVRKGMENFEPVRAKK